ncbi:nucleoside-diphosphate kinase (plasmid) [Streptomyces sp. NBC_00341]|uniref:nucleoside-diphosphate kinase n=1 Tax=unclassified Streptomyces TaxID=2593676 RepID=UPI00095F8B4F|nr:nucleoside-diphosphate kinase [Streptomyces sp. CB02488]OKK13177.1 nucleoside diphosphate kinase [Streptomyces sp. CB02488]WRZ16927.1 nucleoside-diphosphate kinase [Streptomyces sp. NBC_00341]
MITDDTTRQDRRSGVDLSPALSCDPRKRTLFASDTYFLESVEQLAGLTADVEGFLHRHAALLLKPDAVVSRQIPTTVDWLARNGLRIVAAERTRLTRTAVRSLWYYQWNLATPERRRLADLFMDSCDSVVLVVRPEAEEAWAPPTSVVVTERKGPTDPKARIPGQLRYEIGRYSYLLNLVHTPDEPADVARELGVHFDTATRERVYASALEGADQSGRALELAARLHAEVPERELTFAPAAGRLRLAVERAEASMPPGAVRDELRAARLAASTPQGHGPLLEAVWRNGLLIDPWDLVIVGTHVLPMKHQGLAPVLDGPGSADWQLHLARLAAR